MERLDRAVSRQRTARRTAEAFESPTINTVNDIKHVLQQLDPSSRVNDTQDDVKISTELTGSNGRNNTNFEVDTVTSSKSHRQILIEGFKIVKQRLEAAEKVKNEKTVNSIDVNNVPMSPAPVINTKSRLPMDAIIERLLSGHRNGQYICWNLSDGYTYRYEIFQHRLTRVQNAGDTDTTAGGV